VIVPAYQAGGTLAACLHALANQDVPRDCYEIIVVDDGSTDRTADIARRAGARTVTQEHAGAAAARNRGAVLARGELLLFTDADCEPVPGWIRALTAPFANPEVAGAKGTYLTRQTGVVPRFTQLEYEDRYDRMRGAARIDFIDTYSAAYRRDVFFANQGFDPSFWFVEDQEFSFRLAEKGYVLVFAPEAQVYHQHNATLAQYFRRKYHIGEWKVRVTRQHPTQVVQDSHTPEALKAQLILAACSLVALAAAMIMSVKRRRMWGPGWLAFLAGLTVFDLTAVPFYRKIYRKDRSLMGPALALTWARALGLGFGFAAGLLRFRREASEPRPPLTVVERAAKRMLDVAIALLTLPAVALPMLLIGIAIKLDSRGPVLFRQTRIGQKGQPFTIYKFRTMFHGAEHALPLLVNLDALPAPAFKLPGDPRVTCVGRFLRRWSLDELPQLFNVLRGEMSLVGPRPEEVALVARYSDDHRRRLAVKPGMTGPMQVNGRGDLRFEDRLRLELAYIERYSVRKDLDILLRTLPAVVRGEGAY
jgi:lipopolysaccharide/colanic/teichoic acid biosynthesis glycosyltransferase/glycosyltransferase involved in cell wall biosynthesis